MDPSRATKRRKLSPRPRMFQQLLDPWLLPTPTSSLKSSQTSLSNSTTEKLIETSTHYSISLLPPEVLSSIIDYVPKRQWSSLEFVNRSFRDAVYSSWQSLKEFDIKKDVLEMRQSAKGARLYDFLPSILAKLHLRSPMLSSIIGFPWISVEEARYQILHTIRQFTNLKRIDFGTNCLKSMELVEFLTSSASRDRLKEINSKADYLTVDIFHDRNWPEIFATRENSEPEASRLKLEKLSLKNRCDDMFLDPGIMNLIDPSSLTILILDRIAASSDYLLSLITNCSQLQQLQFSFMDSCRCENRPCVHLTSSQQVLDAISAMECLDSLKIGMIDNSTCLFSPDGIQDQPYLDDIDDHLALPIFIHRLGQRGRLVEFGIMHENFCFNQVIAAITQHLPGLKSLELFFTERCRRSGLVNMIKKLVNLEKLAFHCEDYLQGDPADNAITYKMLYAMTKYLRNLKSFHVKYPYDVGRLRELTCMASLQELSISRAYSKELKWKSPFGQQLQSLKLGNCCEDFVVTFLKQVPGLRRLEISGSGFGYRLREEVLRMIPTACPRLRELYLSPSYGNDEKFGYKKELVQAIIEGCPDLEQLRY